MFGFMPVGMRNFAKNNTHIINQAIDKMNKGKLNTNEILDTEELLIEVKTSISQLGSFFSENTRIKELLDFIIKEPFEDEHKTGHKFPFNACEILCSDNQNILNKVFLDQRAYEEEEEEEDDKKHDKNDEDFLMELKELKKEDDPVQINVNSENEKDEEKKESFEIEDVQLEDIIKKEDGEEDIVNIVEKTEKLDLGKDEFPFEKKGDDEEKNLNEKVKEIVDEIKKEVENEKEGKEETQINSINENEVFEINEEENKEEAGKYEVVEDKRSEIQLDTDLLDYFFSFIQTDNQLNFVLSGYFAKVFSHFLNHRQSLLMKYLFVMRPEILDSFLSHLNRKSILECIYKILISYSDDIPNSNEAKTELLKKVLKNFNPDDIDIVTNISDFLIELFSVRKIYLSYINNIELFKFIFDFVLSNISNSSFNFLIKVIQKANENILKDFGQNIVTPVFTFSETQEMFFNFTYNVNNLVNGNTAYNSQADVVEENNVNLYTLHSQFTNIFNILLKATDVVLQDFVSETKKDLEETVNKSNSFENTYGTLTKRLGLRRIHEIEYLRTIFEILINVYSSSVFIDTIDLNLIVEKITNSNFFSFAKIVLFKYQLNSFFQKEFENIVTLITNKFAPKRLIEHFLTETGFLNGLIDESFKSTFEYLSGRKIQSGYFATLSEISSIINDSENVYVKEEFSNNPKWENFIFLYIEPIKQRFKEGILAPNPNVNEFNSIKFGQEAFNSFDNKLEDQKKDEELCKKLPIQDLISQLHDDYILGKRAEVVKNELDHYHKKDEMELLHDDEEDQYHINHEINHPSLLHYGSEKAHSESHEFYDNNFWSSNVIVDELELFELTKSL